MILNNWLRRYRAGAALCRFCPRSWNRIANVLESIEGVGCRIEKTETGWGWQIIVDGNSDGTPPPGYLPPWSSGSPPSGEYPYVAQWNFGVEFSDTDVTIHGGVVYRAGKAYTRANQTEASLTGLADGDLVCLIVEDGGSLGVAVKTSMDDTDGDFVRVLFKASVSGGVADIAKWYGGGIELGAKGTF